LVATLAQTPGSGRVRLQPDWTALEPEMMEQFQAVLRFDTRNPPGNEHIVAEYLKGVFDKAGIPAQIFALDAKRSNVVARLKGNGKKKPLLILGHSDVVTVDEAKWKFPPFSATRDGGWVYARGTVDDKDNLTGGLMTMLLLKRFKVPLDRDVIFLSEAGEEGSSNFGMQFMVSQHYPEIESEYCLAEGGGAIRIGGVAKYTTVETLEKIPRGIELVAHGISGHGSIPLKSNAIVHLAGAVAKVGEWRPEIRFNETTGSYFRGLAQIMRDFTGGKYDLAKQEFSDYMTNFPTNDLASNAQFYLGEIDYAQGNYKVAIVSYTKVIAQYPRSFKVAASQLKKAQAEIKLGNKQAGIRDLHEVVRKYPGSDEARQAQARLRELGVSATTR